MSVFSQVADLPSSLRTRYLASLPEPQEWFLEELVRSGDPWVAPGEGYGVFHGGNLVEFFATDSAKAPSLLSGLHRQRPFTKGLGKSFDHTLMNAAKTLGWALVETGFLFRKRNPATLAKSATFQLTKARPADLDEVWQTGRDFYDSRAEVAQFFRNDGLWVASNDGQMIGSGVMIAVDESGDVVDIGMVTRPDQRNNGFASLIVAGLADRLEQSGKRPICGCAEHNLASKAALTNAGFVTEHRLVQISVAE